MSELLGVLGHIFGGVIAEPGCLRGPGAGDNTYQYTDNGGQQHRPGHPFVFRFGDDTVILDLGGVQVQTVQPFLRFGHDLHQSEKSNETYRQIQPQVQPGNAEGETVIAGHGVGTHTGDEQAQACGNQSLDHTLARYAGNDGQAKDTDHEVLRSTQLGGHPGHLRPQKQQHQGGEDPTEGGGVQGDLQCGLGPALLRQGMPVQHGSCRMGRAWGVDENGGHAASIAPGAVDAKQKHHAGNGGHGVGDGQEQDHAQDNAQSGNGRKNRTDEHTEVDPQDIF